MDMADAAAIMARVGQELKPRVDAEVLENTPKKKRGRGYTKAFIKSKRRKRR